mgnify:FL=1
MPNIENPRSAKLDAIFGTPLFAVLLAIGCPHEIAHGSLRLSLSEETTMEDADFVVDQLKEIIPRLRSMSPLYADFIAKK